MRKLLSIVTALLLASVSGHAQSLGDYFTTNATWTESYGYFPGQYSSNKAYRYIISHDSLINGVTYKLLRSEKLAHWTNYPGHPQLNTYTIAYVNYGILGGLRTTSKQVFFTRFRDFPATHPQHYLNLDFPMGFEKIIYDFDVSVGDTLPWKTVFNVVQQIDMFTLTNSTTTERIKFPSQGGFIDDFWLEGPGSNQGLFGAFLDHIPGSFLYNRYRTICYKNGTLQHNFILSDPYNLCSFVSSAEESNPYSQKHFIFPNPTTGSFRIQFSEGEIAEVTVHDLSGKEISVVTSTSGNLTDVKLPDNLREGLYLVGIKLQNGARLVQKISHTN